MGSTSNTKNFPDTRTGKTPSPHRAAADNQIVLSVRNVSKKFCRRLRYSMVYGFTDLGRDLLSIQSPDRLRRAEFWAVENMSFEVCKGEILGIIGLNGSGKTTLLRLLAGILPPDRGEIMVKGRVASLISLGAGFHPHMTGRENIYLNGAILGMTRREIDQGLQSIIYFSGIGDFIEAPVSTYSSGMRVRLGFSIAVTIQPDIMILDEVLAVGDQPFQAKCFREIDRLSRKSTILLASHSIQKISRVCSQVLVIDHGRLLCQTRDISAGIDTYYSLFELEEGSRSGLGKSKIELVTLFSGQGASSQDGLLKIAYLDALTLEVTLSLSRRIGRAVMYVSFFNQEFNHVAGCRSNLCGFEIRNLDRTIRLRLRIPQLEFTPGLYKVSITVRDEEENEILVKYHAVEHFQVTGNFTILAPIHLAAEWSHID